MLKISKFNLSLKSKPLIIAEVGQSHQGKIKNIEKIINLISKTGADFIKFQTHYGEEESTLDEPFRVKISNYKSRIDYWKSVEFNINEWKKIKNICNKKKIIFLSSPFSIKAVKILHKIGMPAWKIGSGEFTDIPFIHGACYFIKSDVIKKIGVYDDNFFMYVEDLDWYRRISQKYDTIFYKSVIVKHKLARSSHKKLKLFLIHISSIFFYFIKWGFFFDLDRIKRNNNFLLKHED